MHLHPATVEKTKEEKVAEVTCQIVCTTKVLEPIAVTYFSDQCKSDDDMSEASKGSSKTGNAVKTSSDQWTIHFEGLTMTATDADLMDCNKFYVEQLMSVNETDDLKRKKATQNAKEHVRQNNLSKKSEYMRQLLIKCVNSNKENTTVFVNECNLERSTSLRSFLRWSSGCGNHLLPRLRVMKYL